MAFRTNKVPAIEERTVSGSSVSFNSAFALPLKACKVSFSATQASGTPSPSTPLPISGVSAIGLTANSTPVSVSLGDTRYGGELDLLTGELTITHQLILLDGSEAWSTRSTSNGFFKPIADMKTNQNTGMSNWLPYNNSFDSFGFCLRNGSLYANQITNNIEGITNSTEWRAYLSNNPLTAVYELAEPITIQLSANELSSIIGNNTFSTDTGTLEITFADLQEKSASGAVATFNTALAMPLVNGEFTIQAYQEGTGDPSPDNVRNIVGYSALNMTKAGKNLCILSSDTLKRSNGNPPIIYGDNNSVTIDVNDVCSYWGIWGVFQVQANMVGLRLHFSGNISSGLSNSGIRLVSSDNDGFIGAENVKTTLNSSYTIRNSDIGYYFGIMFFNTTGSPQTISNIQLEFGSQATAYEPFVTPEVKTKALGETVYGGSYNSVSGKLLVTWGIVNLADVQWTTFAGIKRTTDISNIKYVQQNTQLGNGMSERYTMHTGSGMSTATNCIAIDTAQVSVNSPNEQPQGLFAYELATPIEIQLTPEEIQTFIGDNNIFCDTGDTSLVYKDLDIAKRGNFREVFKLPS